MPPKPKETTLLQNQLIYLFLMLLIVFVLLTGLIVFKGSNNLEKMKTIIYNMFCVNIQKQCIPIGILVTLPLLILLNYYVNNPAITFLGTFILCLLFVLWLAPLPTF
jgi:hypothetical protein